MTCKEVGAQSREESAITSDHMRDHMPYTISHHLWPYWWQTILSLISLMCGAKRPDGNGAIPYDGYHIPIYYGDGVQP